MTTKNIEKCLNNNFLVDDFEVDYCESKDKYTIELDIVAPRESADVAALLKLKNEIRSKVNKAYRIEFVIRFTT